MSNEFNEIKVAELAVSILSNLSNSDADIEVKSAALKSAEAIIDNAIGAKAMNAVVFNMLNPKH